MVSVSLNLKKTKYFISEMGDLIDTGILLLKSMVAWLSFFYFILGWVLSRSYCILWLSSCRIV